MSSISISIFSLAKNNNGLFKSEKQANFILQILQDRQNYITAADSGYNSCPIFAYADKLGITKIVKGNKAMFERKVEGVISPLEAKKIKSKNRRIKKLEKQLAERLKAFENGEYSKDEYSISLYWKFTNELIERIESLKNGA